MNPNNSVNGTATSDVLSSAFIKALVQQIRGLDTYGTYKKWSDDLLLKPYIVTKQDKRKISVEDEVDPRTISRINAFYRAIAIRIEQETGLLSQVVADLNHEGFGWVLVFSGRLLLVKKTMRDVHRFGFNSLEKLAEEGDILVQKGVELAQRFREVGEL
ncbi:NifX-associated nitrogen fixation protein [Calothrix sp. CCY 0018]|uniref:NifX-associated nitrogen fixation protein n=1 Tax=Calothrix sp. CCY 0018 TaxID=3103864 RepID=UPI0039C618E3